MVVGFSSYIPSIGKSSNSSSSSSCAGGFCAWRGLSFGFASETVALAALAVGLAGLVLPGAPDMLEGFWV